VHHDLVTHWDDLAKFFHARLDEAEGADVANSILRDIVAKRRVVREFERCGPATFGHVGLRTAVQMLAEQFDEHPDYREAWRP
jgi:Family of unknown function (DUF6221)